MSLNTLFPNRKEYFLSLSRKIYLSPSDSILEDCSGYLDSLAQDISALESLDLSGYPIHYGRREISIPFSTTDPMNPEEENGALLDSLVENYEFTNIRSEDKKEQ